MKTTTRVETGSELVEVVIPDNTQKPAKVHINFFPDLTPDEQSRLVLALKDRIGRAIIRDVVPSRHHTRAGVANWAVVFVGNNFRQHSLVQAKNLYRLGEHIHQAASDWLKTERRVVPARRSSTSSIR